MRRFPPQIRGVATFGRRRGETSLVQRPGEMREPELMEPPGEIIQPLLRVSRLRRELPRALQQRRRLEHPRVSKLSEVPPRTRCVMQRGDPRGERRRRAVGRERVRVREVRQRRAPVPLP